MNKAIFLLMVVAFQMTINRGENTYTVDDRGGVYFCENRG